MGPLRAAHCGPRYRREMRGTCGPHTMGPRWGPIGTAQSVGWPTLSRVGPHWGQLWAHSKPTLWAKCGYTVGTLG
ncbi:hypothetical protein PO909_005858 [Leuciscus waleckii]